MTCSNMAGWEGGSVTQAKWEAGEGGGGAPPGGATDCVDYSHEAPHTLDTPTCSTSTQTSYLVTSIPSP